MIEAESRRHEILVTEAIAIVANARTQIGIAPVEHLLAVSGVVGFARAIDRVDLIGLQHNVVRARRARIVRLVDVAYPVLPKISRIVEIVARKLQPGTEYPKAVPEGRIAAPAKFRLFLLNGQNFFAHWD